MRSNPLTLEVIEILNSIETRGSFSKAAEELNKATSALSYAIQKLEDQLGISIYQRQGRRSVLTPAGQLILEEGRKVLLATQIITKQAQELATGWEPRIRIALDSMLNYELFFEAVAEFLLIHPSLEIDITECVLNGGWEALEQDQVDLLIGSPGPVPLHKGFRATVLPSAELVPVIAAKHPLSKIAHDRDALEKYLPDLRRVVSHDSSRNSIVKTAGLSIGKKNIFTQTIDQKLAAQLAGLGIGHLPKHRIQHYLESGELLPLNIEAATSERFIAWKMSNKGKALASLRQTMEALNW